MFSDFIKKLHISSMCKIGLQGVPSDWIIILYKWADATRLFKTISLLKFILGPKTVAGLKIIVWKVLSESFNISFSALYLLFAYAVMGLIF